MLEQGGIYPVGAADVHHTETLGLIPITARVPSRLDELGEDALAVLGDAVVEGTEGPEILSRIFEAVDEVEVGLSSLLVPNIAIVLDLDPPNVNGCWGTGRAARCLRRAKMPFV